ncbi:MAG: acyl carrier protein, partial [Cyanobacteria bacterium P01_G01_bin.67]
IASHKSLAQEADKTTDMIESYGKAIGNIQQNLAGEDRDVDELLESRGVLKDTATHKGAEEQGKNNLLPVTCPSGAEHSLAPVGDAGSPLYPLPITPTKQQKSSEVEEWLSQWLSSKLQIPLEKIDRAKAFADYGIDSVMAVELAQDLEEWLPDDLEIEPTLAWNFPSIEALAGYLTGEQRSRGSRRVEEKTVTRYPDSSVPLRQRRRGVSNLPVIPDNEDKSKIHKQDIDKLSEDELARSLLEEIALAKERDN